ncbi:phosphohistidine phosphatase SixA [Haliea sp. AH-315-K21]|nr:phosphohistidine phosphatase SixA [Haliea sp. AH-315-K21]MBN4075201.1 phosphohistidine phosphatase SixA [Gammaproteobacteria bacterium AH-315-E17]
MNVYLLRHGQAEQSAARDSLRCLTPQGVKDIGSVAASFAMTHYTFDRCFVSPFVRTQQTADLFLKGIGASCALESEDVLRPENNPSGVLRLLETIENHNILLIGHNPLLSELYAKFTTAQSEYGVRVIAPGELYGINFEVLGWGLGRDVLNILADKP